MKSLLKFFNSVKLAIVLIITITAVSIIGTLIPQHRPPAEYMDRYGQWANLLIRLEFTALYQSWWFLSLLVLLSLNITVCTLTRLSPKLRKVFRPSLDFKKKSLQVMKINDRFKKNEDLNKAYLDLKKELASRRYRIKENKEENRIFLLARKRTLGVFGSDIVHLGLLIILSGGIISGVGGFRANLQISEGQILPIPQTDFKLRLDNFDTEYYPNGAVKDWKSTLTVMEEGKAHLTKTVEVNHPLSYRGYVFYQSSYGWDWKNPTLVLRAKKNSDPDFSEKTDLKLGEKVGLAGLEISALHFVPDFVINENREIATRSLQPNNPAAYIEGWQGEDKILSGWIFSKFPDFNRIHFSQETDLNLTLEDFRANQYSGIQMAKDPGVNFIWTGCTVLMIGLFVAFFWPAKEIKMTLEESQGKTELTAGGTAPKNKEAFASEFHTLMASLRRLK
jgi:cytochrome c biogenesis protein